MKLKFLLAFLIFLICLPVSPALAQTELPLPVYIVQPGDSLYSIALRFGVSLNSLIDANTIDNPNSLDIGAEIRIPGYEGIEGTIESILVQPGQSFRNLTILSNADLDTLGKLSHITSPTELYIGSEIFIIKSPEEILKTTIGNITATQSLEEFAIKSATNPWIMSLTSLQESESHLIMGDTVFLPSDLIEETSNFDSTLIEISPLPVIQGKTFLVSIKSDQELSIRAELKGQKLYFYPDGENKFIALAGTSALDEPGIIPFSIQLYVGTSEIYALNQQLLVQNGNYPPENVVGVDSSTIDPKTIEEEEQILNKLVVNTDTKYWTSNFSYPVDEPCFGSTFGRSRTYNGGAYYYYHTGVDFTVCSADNLNIYATAPGKVIFSEILPIKGIFTIIDHGWGVYSGYAHQSESYVNPGEFVQAGDLIGIIGNTGRSVGPHLHWEIWINGIPVDPLQWVTEPISNLK